MSASVPFTAPAIEGFYSQVIRTITCAAALLFPGSVVATPAQPALTTKEAVELLGVEANQAHTTPAVWNGKQTVFVDYPIRDDKYGDMRRMSAVQWLDGRLIKVSVTTGEPEGGDAEITAIGFANADRDQDRELIVILKWEQKHYDYEGRFWEVRVFDDWKPGQSALVPLTRLSTHFGLGCECYYRDERKPERYRFTTIGSVKKELRRLGY